MLKIDKALCLCLDKRQDEWDELKEQCESHGIEFDPFVVGKGKLLPFESYDRIDDKFPPVEHWQYGNPITKKNHCNAFLSHQSMIRKALSEGAETVLLLEDDAYFTSRYDDVLGKLNEELKELDFDMLYLGWWIGNEYDEWNVKVEKEYKEEGKVGIGRIKNAHFTCGGLHGVIVKKPMLQVMTQLSPVNPIDSQLNRIAHRKINSYYVFPKIIHDKGIFSHCEQAPCPRSKI